ncbi:copper resistance CopC/CopD family protein [Brachybacterium kimchii]|uniref:Copper resistance protein CopC/CopD n=1 Tax=Brachybacterium kimchii TaxID=2942909 RepID=A0ABY4N3I6_9MICO|nr:copper resistance protein CopC [Brachybacterium kimchii]UQN29117.1 copper resistance protein CopC/CopD [Brachybacterium kimchii]
MTHLRIPALRVLLGSILGLLLMLGGAAPALAHAQLESSSPADGTVLEHAPASATLTFDEHVRPIDGETRLTRPDGTSTTLEAHSRDDDVLAALPSDLPDGSYVLTYRVVSADGHPVTGTLDFSVGAPSTIPAAPSAGSDTGADAGAGTDTAAHEEPGAGAATLVPVLTVAEYLSLLVMAGMLLCSVLVARGAAARAVMASGRATRALRGLALVAAAAAVLLVPVTAAEAAGWTRMGAGLSAPPVVGAGAVVLGAALVIGAGGARRPALSVPGALLAMVAPVLVGHSASIAPRPLMLVADVAHLLAGAVWSGGLLAAIAMLTVLHRHSAAAEGVAVVRRFSLVALVSVLVLAASGTTMAVLILDTPSALVTSAWGRTLLVKLVVVAVAVGLAAWNRTRLLPAIASADAPWERLLRIMRREAALLLGVLAVTGLLVNLSPHVHSMESMSGTESAQVDAPVAPATSGAA